MPGFGKSPSSNPYPYRTPADQGLPYEDVEIESEKGACLRGWLLKQPKNSEHTPTIIFYHENAGNLGTRMDYIRSYFEICQVNVLMVSYRGYGDSDGAPGMTAIQKDGVAILKHVFARKDIDNRQVFTHGRSLGGAVSAYSVVEANKLGADHRVAGVILENTFTSIADMVKEIFPSIATFASFILTENWDTLSIVYTI